MREYITDHAVANAIRMKRSLFVGAFLVVEGVNDKLIYGLVTDRETCAIEIAHGRENALGAIRVLNADGFKGVLGIVDADATNITGEVIPESNILKTDLHDLECMMLDSPAFDRILEELGSDERVSAFAEKAPLIARQLAINASPLGCLRLISLHAGLQLKFEGLTFSRFDGASDLKIDVVKMVREVVNNSHKHHLAETELEKQVANESQKGHDCWQISCGHDIVEILSVAFRKTFSGRSTGSVASDTLERCLRLAYEAAHLRETKLYRAMVVWECRNPSWSVLPSSRGIRKLKSFRIWTKSLTCPSINHGANHCILMACDASRMPNWRN